MTESFGEPWASTSWREGAWKKVTNITPTEFIALHVVNGSPWSIESCSSSRSISLTEWTRNSFLFTFPLLFFLVQRQAEVSSLLRGSYKESGVERTDVKKSAEYPPALKSLEAPGCLHAWFLASILTFTALSSVLKLKQSISVRNLTPKG